MPKIVTIVGARPQIIKAAALSRVIREQYATQITEVMVHTGQHYDANMSQVFFQELGIPPEDYNLGVGSASHARQTAQMMLGLEEIFLKEQPDYVLIYGDTNSTLAAAVVAVKLNIPLLHVESGVRMGDKRNVEELNRIVSDHFATILFYYVDSALFYLRKEGFPEEHRPPYHINTPGLVRVGDIMYDNSLHFKSLSDERITLLADLGLSGKDYILLTIHRDNNTDDPECLNAIFPAFEELTRDLGLPVVFPMHPRTRKCLEAHPELWARLQANPDFHILPPASFLEIIQLESNAALVATDSGGVQREAYFFQRPCLIVNYETPWPELVESGSAVVTGNRDKARIKALAAEMLAKRPSLQYPPVFGDGHAAEAICATILEDWNARQSG